MRKISVLLGAMALGLLATGALHAATVTAVSAPAPALAALLSTLTSDYPVTALVVMFAAVSLAASVIVAVTPTPAPGTRYYAAYQLLEWLALVTANTKKTGIPAVDAMHQVELAVVALKKSNAAPPAADDTTSPSAATASTAMEQAYAAIGKAVGSVAPVLLVLLASSMLLLGGCANSNTQASLGASVNSLNSAIVDQVSKFNAGKGQPAEVAKAICAAVPVADLYFKVLAPASGATPDVVKAEDVAVQAANETCATPGVTPAKLIAVYLTVQKALGKVDAATADAIIKELEPPAQAGATPASSGVLAATAATAASATATPGPTQDATTTAH